MKCGSVSHLLNKYVDNELPEGKRFFVKEHLAGCDKCTKSFNEASKLKGLLAATTPYSVDPFLLKQIADKIKNITPVPFSIVSLKLLHIWAIIAGILIISSGLVMYKISTPEKNQNIAAKTISDQILEMPITPENMEKITLNLLVYTNGKPLEAPYVKF